MLDVQCDCCGSWNTEHYGGNSWLCLDCEDITSSYEDDEEE